MRCSSVEDFWCCSKAVWHQGGSEYRSNCQSETAKYQTICRILKLQCNCWHTSVWTVSDIIRPWQERTYRHLCASGADPYPYARGAARHTKSLPLALAHTCPGLQIYVPWIRPVGKRRQTSWQGSGIRNHRLVSSCMKWMLRATTMHIMISREKSDAPVVCVALQSKCSKGLPRFQFTTHLALYLSKVLTQFHFKAWTNTASTKMIP